MGAFTRRLVHGARETCAITVSRPKSAALAFDKVYASKDFDVPQKLRPVYARAGNIAVTGGTAARAVDFRPSAGALDLDIATGAKGLCRGLQREGLRPVRYYDERTYEDQNYTHGDDRFIGITLRNINVVDEDELTWEQVLQFRNDDEAVAAYRRIRHWFDVELAGKSQAFVEDAIAKKMDAYKGALAKHGFRARRGEITSYLATASVLGGTIAGSASVIVAAAAVVGAIFVTETVLAKIEEIDRDARAVRVGGQGSEVSFVHRMEALKATQVGRQSASPMLRGSSAKIKGRGTQ